MSEELIYSKTTKEGNEFCFIIKNAHIVKVDDDIFIVTVSTLFNDFDSITDAYVYSNESEAKAFCDGFIE